VLTDSSIDAGCLSADGFVDRIVSIASRRFRERNGKKVIMRPQILKSWLIVCALSFATKAFAANSGSLHVASTEDVAGQRLAIGDYTVRWEGNGPDVELRFMQGKKIAATAMAHARPLQDVSRNDAALIDTGPEARRTLSQIFFAGKSVAFEIPMASEQTSVSGGH
jgi:hypothetical protein